MTRILIVGAGFAGMYALARARQAVDEALLSWELRSATSLARLRHRQHRTRMARQTLAPVLRRFTEGFQTADLVSAAALLNELGKS